MPNDDIINDLLEQLIAHRNVLQTLITQQIQMGIHTYPYVIGEIATRRHAIARIKSELGERGEVVDNHPNDDDPTDERLQNLKAESRSAKLRARFSNHTSFINNRIDSFVGRAAELAAIRQRITELLPSGGYVTITGQAGQGKSSIIAALLAQHSRAASLDALLAPDADLPIEAVTKESVEAIAHHFIPFNPGPNHQVSLLRNLIARLALQHNLPDIYLASDSRPALKDYFATAIAEVAASGAQAVIYIDGLDQIEEDPSGLRDLSFLTTNPPPGIVFVLGTRPNDTLKPLELLKPHNEYQLPMLKRPDFDLILRHRQVTIAPHTADRFYAVMAGNALFLDLAAQEIGAAGVLPPEQIIARLADDPANLFSFAIDRLKRSREVWYDVIKPLLGVLLATRDSLSHAALRALTRADADAVRDALQRLGGLVARDEHGRFYLFHLKLRAFLGEQSENDNTELTERTPFFEADERAGYHQRLATWCNTGKGGLPAIWQPNLTDAAENERRAYAREHYITHLAAANNWDELWAVVEAGTYGRAKLRHDPSTRAYVQDLDRVRDAVLVAAADLAEPGVVTLPRLWRYSLLRGSLASRADNYPDGIFTLLAQLGREQEAIDLAEVLSNAGRKAKTLYQIGAILHRHGLIGADVVIARAIAVAQAIEHPWLRIETLRAVAEAQAEAGLWEAAEATARAIEDADTRAYALISVARAQAEAGLWDAATTTARAIENADTRAYALSAVAKAQAAAGLWDAATTTARAIEDADTRAYALISVARAQAEAGLWDAATTTARAIENASPRASALSAVAKAQAAAGERSVALALLDEAVTTARTIENVDTRAYTLSTVAEAQAAAGLWDAATTTARVIEQEYTRASALSAVVQTQAAAGAWDAAITTARAIEDASTRARALGAVAKAQAAAGAWEAATTTARAIEDASTRARALGAVAKAQAAAGAWDAATTTARAIEDASTRAEALGAVAQAQAVGGERSAALALLDEAITTTRAIEAASTRAYALRAVAQAQVAAGLRDEAMTTARTIEDADTRASTLSAVARAQAAAGEYAKLRNLVQSAWRQATTRDEMWGLLSLANHFIIADPPLVPALLAGADWVTEFFKSPS